MFGICTTCSNNFLRLVFWDVMCILLDRLHHFGQPDGCEICGFHYSFLVSLALLSIMEMELVSETLFDQLEMAFSVEECTKLCQHKPLRHTILCHIPKCCNWNVYCQLMTHCLHKLSRKCDKPFRTLCTLAQKRV